MSGALPDLAQGATVRVTQVKHERRGAEYPARVVHTDGTHVTVAAVWTERVEREHFSFEPGDRSIEHYWTDRWYSIWQVHAADGRLKGWYCNVARPARVDRTTLVSEDLELDLWVPQPPGAPIRLDEDEFTASGLPERDHAAAANAMRALDELEALSHGQLQAILEPPVAVDHLTAPEWPTPHQPAQTIVARTITFGQVRWAGPGIAVSDRGDVAVYFRPKGTTNKVTVGTLTPTGRRDRELALRAELLARHFIVVDKTTGPGTGSLIVADRREPFSVWLQKDTSRGHYLPAYVNIEAPHRRTRIGFDTDDLCLDITLDATLDWLLKDDGDLDERTELGIYSGEQRRAIRAAAARAIIRAETRQFPFDQSWTTWEPDPTWPLPVLPRNWNEGTTTKDAS
jgi:predicted RNA-binding protein associated with RNAse of E/G family